jgi:hypothetical protein
MIVIVVALVLLLGSIAFAASLGDYFDVSPGEEVEAGLVPGLLGVVLLASGWLIVRKSR